MPTDIIRNKYNDMVCLAQAVLLDYGFYKFPIDVFGLASKIGMRLIPYSALSFDRYERLSAMKGTEKGITITRIHHDGTIKYDTYYNDVDMNVAACRFTIAHEIKHIVSGDCLKNEDDLTELDEQLADYFAKCLLAPQSIIIAEQLQAPEEYIEEFGLSYQAASIWFDAVEKRKYRFGDEYLFDYEKEFLKEIET